MLNAALNTICVIWYNLYHLVPLVQFKKREKYLRRSVDFSKVVGFKPATYKINTLPWVFFTFFKLYTWYQIAQHTTFTQ